MITVIGHKNPDTDSTASAIAWSWFLNQQGGESRAVLAGEPNREAVFVLKEAGVATPTIVSSLSEGEQVVLVDTNNPEELVSGWDKAVLVGIVDHHKLAGGLSTPEPIAIRIEPVACTCTIIKTLMDAAGITPDKQVATLMLGAILSDTLKFTSPTTTPRDREVAETLAHITGIDMDQFAADMFTAKSDLTGFSPADILQVDSKVFTLGGKKYRISVLETTNTAPALAMRTDLEAALAAVKLEEQLDGAMLFIVDIIASSSEVLVPSDVEKDIVSKAFSVNFGGPTAHLPGVVSRKKQMVPRIEESLR